MHHRVCGLRLVCLHNRERSVGAAGMDAKRTTVRDMRRANRSVLLTRLYRDGPLSRNELVQSTALSKASVSNLAGELIEEGIVEEAGQVESDGGRPRALLRVAPEFGYVVGVDVGETRVQVELFDMSMTARAKTDYGIESAALLPAEVVSRVLDGLRTVVAQAGIDPARVLGVGVAVSGVVERTGDAVVHAQTLGWDAVPLGAMLRAGTDLPVHVDNGAQTLGQAEMWFGAGRGARHAVIALVGSGVGAAVVADGASYRGSRSSAGEWGHTTIVYGGRRWGLTRSRRSAPSSRRHRRPRRRCSPRQWATSAPASPRSSTCSTRSGSFWAGGPASRWASGSCLRSVPRRPSMRFASHTRRPRSCCASLGRTRSPLAPRPCPWRACSTAAAFAHRLAPISRLRLGDGPLLVGAARTGPDL